VKISETYELADGTVQFQGEISGPELDLVIQAGLLTLMRNGVITSAVKEREELPEGDLH
jgi:hypothetical protein